MFISRAQLIFKDEGLIFLSFFFFRDHMLNSKTYVSKFKYLH